MNKYKAKKVVPEPFYFIRILWQRKWPPHQKARNGWHRCCGALCLKEQERSGNDNGQKINCNRSCCFGHIQCLTWKEKAQDKDFVLLHQSGYPKGQKQHLWNVVLFHDAYHSTAGWEGDIVGFYHVKMFFGYIPFELCSIPHNKEYSCFIGEVWSWENTCFLSLYHVSEWKCLPEVCVVSRDLSAAPSKAFKGPQWELCRLPHLFLLLFFSNSPHIPDPFFRGFHLDWVGMRAIVQRCECISDQWPLTSGIYALHTAKTQTNAAGGTKLWAKGWVWLADEGSVGCWGWVLVASQKLLVCLRNSLCEDQQVCASDCVCVCVCVVPLHPPLSGAEGCVYVYQETLEMCVCMHFCVCVWGGGCWVCMWLS